MAYAVCIVYCDSYNYFACVYRVVLVVFVSKDAIKSVPSNKTSVSASRRFRFVPVLDNWCQKWDWRRDGTDDNEDDYGRQPCAPAKSWGGYVPHPVHWWRLNTAVDGVVGCQ